MFQIVQGMYFRQVPLTNMTHRRVHYTNLSCPRNVVIDAPFGRLLPSTEFNGIHTLTVEAKEQLETVRPDGTPEILVATGGDQLLDEIADVVSFCLNAVCVRDLDMARRLIAAAPGARFGPSAMLRRTFDANRQVTVAELADLNTFVATLVGLERRSYEAAMRAIRQVVAATRTVHEDPTLSYTLMVAALESLGTATTPRQATWDEYDAKKRARIDAAIEDLDAAQQDRVRAAVLENEHAGLQRKFVAFALDHIGPDYYRREAMHAIRPISAKDLPNALRQAYSIRSRNVHALEYIAPELVMSDQADTSRVESQTLLAHEGLARLSRHVVRRYAEIAPRGVTDDFDYRFALPGIVMGELASQYWIHSARGFGPKSAHLYLDGMIDHFIEGASGRGESHFVMMDDVLASAERSVLGLAEGRARHAMAGLIGFWNAFAAPEHLRQLSPRVASYVDGAMATPGILAFALAVFKADKVSWDVADLEHLAVVRRSDANRLRTQPMPVRIDAALELVLAERLLVAGQRAEGLTAIGRAVELVPGVEDLIRFEDAVGKGELPKLSILKFVLRVKDFIQWPLPGENPTA